MSLFFVLVLLPEDIDATTLAITSHWQLTSLFIFEDIHQSG